MKRTGVVDWLVLGVLCVSGVFLQRLQTDARAAGRPDALGSLSAWVLSPVTTPTTAVALAVQDFFGGLWNARRLTAENAQLRAQAAAMRLYDERVAELQRQIDSLRRLQGLPNYGRQRVAAQVTAWFPYENRLSLNVGEDAGVRAGMPVVSPDGLVGTVQTVAAGSCQVLLLSAPRAKIGAVIESRNPPSVGLLRGETSTSLVLELDDPNSAVQVGDRVVTAGFSERIPRGIPIGSVVEVAGSQEFGVRRATVFPAVSLGLVREVYVLR